MRESIPSSVVRRLTKYLTCLQEAGQRGLRWVSSLELAEQLGLTSSTVRQDLRHVDFSGRSKRGYEVAGLKKALERLLGADQRWPVVVVGAGNLGRALAQHEEFERRGFAIEALFDDDPAKVGRRCGRLTVRSMDEIGPALAGRGAVLGVIAVPAGSAQRVADLLIAAGVRGLLNLSPGHIIAPQRVPTVDARVVASLQELAHAVMARRLAAKPAPRPRG